MKVKAISLVVVLFIVSNVFSQNGDNKDLPEHVNVNKPTVYLEYICQDKNSIYLRLYNNTIWQIIVGAEKSYFPTTKPIRLRNGNKGYAIPDDEEVPIHYYVEKDELQSIRGIEIPRKQPYSLNQAGRIVSKDSIRFSVPVEHLRKGLKIYVGFAYEWDAKSANIIGEEPEHRVYFRGGDIGSANTDIIKKNCTPLDVRNGRHSSMMPKTK